MKEQIEEAQALNSVKEFHERFGHVVNSLPTIDKSVSDLRISLIGEEFKELQDAISDNDIVGVADALADIQYVLSGTILSFGLGDIFGELFAEVHRSNMSKACNNIEEVSDTIEFYKAKGVDATFSYDNGKYNVYRISDNKTLKSINYSPADLATIINKNSI